MTIKNHILWFFVLLFCYVLCLTFLSPLWSDDYGRSIPLTNLLEIWSHIHFEYFAWNSRIAVLFFTYLFLWKNSAAIFIFNIINSIVFILLIYLIFLNAYAKKPRGFYDLCRLFLIFNLVWFLPTVIGEVSFWRSGAINYLWVLTASLALIYPLTRLLIDNVNVVPKSFIVRILLFFASLTLATCLENVSATMCLFLVGSIFYLKYQKHMIPQWVYYVTCGYIIGTLILTLAPGHAHRVADLAYDYSYPYQFLYLAIKILGRLVPFILIFWLVIFLLKKTKYQLSLTQIKRLLLFSTLALLAAFAMMGARHVVHFDGRTAFATDIFAIVALACLFPPENTRFYHKFILPIILFVLLPLCALDMTNVLINYHTYFTTNNMRETIIAKNLSLNNKDIVFPAPSVNPPNTIKFWLNKISAYRLIDRDLEVSPKSWINRAAAQYYGVKSIRLEKNLVNR